jgi:hypothetical protein
MWLTTNRGFFSGIAHRDDPETIMVRARTDRHLEAIMDLLPEGTQIVRTPHADYPCRVVISREVWLALVTALAAEVDYPNFKDSVDDRARGKGKKAVKDAAYDHSVYMSVWSVMRRLTSERELRMRRGRSGGGRGGRRARAAEERLFMELDGEHAARVEADDVSMTFDPWPLDDPLRPDRRVRRDVEALQDFTRRVLGDLGVDGPERA